MREFLATPFLLITSISDWCYTFISGNVIVRLTLPPEHAEEILQELGLMDDDME